MMQKLRILIICFVVASVSLPMVWVSLGKFLLFGLGLFYAAIKISKKQTDINLFKLKTTKIIFAVLIYLIISFAWTEAPLNVSLSAFVKHGKILEIILLVFLIRNSQEAKFALQIFFISQIIFISTSWLMVSGWHIPWSTSEKIPEFKYVVYSTYLDQTLIFAAAAGVFWFLRDSFNLWRWGLALMTALALSNNLILQNGKTGFVVSCVVIAMILIHQLPQKIKWITILVIPLLVTIGAYTTSNKLQSKVSQVITEAQDYALSGKSLSSSGFRLHAWKRSIEAISEKPINGHGIGSWTLAVKKIEGAQGDEVFGRGMNSNPHQEYLMWGVEFGLMGMAMLLMFMFYLLRDASGFPAPIKYAVTVVVTVMAIACLFNASLYDALIGDFFCVTLGILFAFGLRSQVEQTNLLNTSHTVV